MRIKDQNYEYEYIFDDDDAPQPQKPSTLIYRVCYRTGFCTIVITAVFICMLLKGFPSSCYQSGKLKIAYMGRTTRFNCDSYDTYLIAIS